MGGRNKGEEGKEGEHCGVQKNILKIDPDLLYVYGLADHTQTKQNHTKDK